LDQCGPKLNSDEFYCRPLNIKFRKIRSVFSETKHEKKYVSQLLLRLIHFVHKKHIKTGTLYVETIFTLLCLRMSSTQAERTFNKVTFNFLIKPEA